MFRRFIKTEKQRCRESGSAIASSLSRREPGLSRGSPRHDRQTQRACLFDRRGARDLFFSVARATGRARLDIRRINLSRIRVVTRAGETERRRSVGLAENRIDAIGQRR